MCLRTSALGIFASPLPRFFVVLLFHPPTPGRTVKEVRPTWAGRRERRRGNQIGTACLGLYLLLAHARNAKENILLFSVAN